MEYKTMSKKAKFLLASSNQSAESLTKGLRTQHNCTKNSNYCLVKDVSCSCVGDKNTID